MAFYKLLLAIVVPLLFISSHLAAGPVVTSVVPNNGPTTASTNITIIGSGFTNTSAVNVGNIPATNVIVVSDTKITAIIPAQSFAGAPGTVDITVTEGSSTSPITRGDLFTYTNDWHAIAPVPTKPSFLFEILIQSPHGFEIAAPLGTDSQAIAVTPDAKLGYNADLESPPRFTRIDFTTNITIVTPLTGYAYPARPTAIAITTDGMKAYIVDRGNNQLIPVSIVSNAIVAPISIPLAVQVDGIALSNDGKTAYVTDMGKNVVWVVDLVGATPTFPIGSKFLNVPKALAITPDGTMIYICNHGSNMVTAIKTSSPFTAQSFVLPSGFSHPNSIAINAVGTMAYVTCDIGPSSIAGSIIPITIGQSIRVGNPILISSDPLIATHPIIAISVTPDSKKACGFNNRGLFFTYDFAAQQSFFSSLKPPSFIAITPDQAPVARFTSFQSDPLTITFDASGSISPVGTIAKYEWDFGDATYQTVLGPITTIRHTYAKPGTYTVTLKVTNSAGTSTPDTSTFTGQTMSNHGDPRLPIVSQQVTVVACPTVASISPTSGLFTGGTKVTITGTGFLNTTTVTFAQKEAKFKIISDTEIIAIVPRGTGTVDVTVTTVGCTIFAGQFTYISILPPVNAHGRQVSNEFLPETDIINILKWSPPKKGDKPVAYKIFRDKQLTDLVARVSAKEKLRFKDHNRKDDRTYTYFIVSIDKDGTASSPAVVVVRPQED